jgi:hypothetical protein
MIHNRFDSYYSQTTDNAKRLGLKNIYYYANQSRFESRPELRGSIYQAADEFLQKRDCIYMHQLSPGDSVALTHKINPVIGSSESLFSFQLRALEKYLNNSYQRYCHGAAQFQLHLTDNKCDIIRESINYVANKPVWNRILTGELTLEAITIGGCGSIYKPEANIRDHHHFISKQSYIIQNKIKSLGINFFRE